MNENFEGIVEKNLASARERITVPADLDTLVLRSSSLIKPRPVFPSFAFIGLGVLMIAVFGMILMAGISRTNQECVKVLKGMTDALNNRDLEKSVSFFDFHGTGADEKAFRNNFTLLYNQYDRIRYEARDIVVKPGPGGAVARSHFILTMHTPDGQTVISSGSDRIWFTKTSEGLKILCRITEDEKKI